MPGPVPKHPSTRARQNRTTTVSTLRADPGITAPELPDIAVWHPMTLAWCAERGLSFCMTVLGWRHPCPSEVAAGHTKGAGPKYARAMLSDRRRPS